MALTKEDLQAISSLMDGKLEPFNEKLDSMDKRLDDMDQRLEFVEMKQDLMQKKLDDLAFDMKVSERAIKKEIRLLQDAQNTLIVVLQGKGILNMAAN